MLRVERHELDEAHFESVLTAEARQRNEIRLHQILHRNRIQLDGAKTQAFGYGDTFEHFIQLVAARDLAEALTVERIQMHVEPPQAGLVQRLGKLRQCYAVGS
jgi:hypothetical protein